MRRQAPEDPGKGDFVPSRMLAAPSTHHDVVVVGGRAAGAATALLLARAGLDVLLLDRTPADTTTLSTHALMPGGVVQLHRWGLLDAVVDAGTPAVRLATFHFGGEVLSMPIKPAHGIDAVYAPRRTVLEPILIDAATDAGAAIHHGTTVHSVIRDGAGRVVGVEGRDAQGRAVRHAARWVVGADGVQSVVARAVAAPVERRGLSATATVYGYWPDLEVDGYEWIFRPDACAGAIPTNGGATCVFTAASSRTIGRGGLDVLHHVARVASPGLAYRLATARPAAAVHTFAGRPGYLRRPWGPGWALVGDAGYWKDPIGAHGLTDALRDAELLSIAIARAMAGDLSEVEALDHYHRSRDLVSIPLFDVLDEIAGMRWTDDDIGPLLRRFNAAMTDEVEMLAGLTVASTCS